MSLNRASQPSSAEHAPTRFALDLWRTLMLVYSQCGAGLVWLGVLAVIQALTPAATLWVGKLLLDSVAQAIVGRTSDTEASYHHLAELLALQVGIGAVVTLLSAVGSIYRDVLSDKVQHGTNLRVLEKAVSLDVATFEEPSTHDALKNAYGEVGARPLGTLFQLVAMGQALITLTTISALMARLGARVVPFVIAASIPSVLVSMKFGAKTFRMMRRQVPELRIQAYIGSLLISELLVKELRLFAFERYLIDAWKRGYTSFRTQVVALMYRRNLWSVGASLISAALMGAATLFALRRAAERTITVGDFSLFVVGLGQLQAQLVTLLGSIAGLFENVLYLRNLFEFLDLPSADQKLGDAWQGAIERIEFEHVSFRYPGADRDALTDISFAVKKGEVLAFVGENGSGKSTLVKLITRLYEPTSGRILINGLDARRFSPQSLQVQMSAIFQDYGQYQVTARENIAFSDLDAIYDDYVIEEAAAKATATGFLRAMPQAYDTVLGRLFEGGRQLSVGQWQRVALARMYFRQVSVQIFDEPTAALDPTAEATAVEQLHSDASERIIIIISHRLSTIRASTQIGVLERGQLCESGTHFQLLASGGTYARLFERQELAHRKLAEESVHPA